MKKVEHKAEVLTQGILFLPQLGIGNKLEEQQEKLAAAAEEGWKLAAIETRPMFFIFKQVVAYYTREV